MGKSLDAPLFRPLLGVNQAVRAANVGPGEVCLAGRGLLTFLFLLLPCLQCIPITFLAICFFVVK